MKLESQNYSLIHGLQNRIDVLASMKTTLILNISISWEPSALSMNSNILKGIFFLSSRSQQ